jgi:glutamine amidotransferase
MIAIVDYQAGNLTSVRRALDRLNAPCVITSDPAVVRRSTKIIVPGVGHFSATSVLGSSGLRKSIADALNRGIPFLGICVGMQWMFEGSAEAPDQPGLGFFPGTCTRFPVEVKSPHVGWNQLSIADSSYLLRGIPSGEFVYFTHSYRAPVVPDTAAECEYGGTFAAAVERDNIFGVQFHPEKSGAVGHRLLQNFCDL